MYTKLIIQIYIGGNWEDELILSIEDIDTFDEVYFNCCRAEPNNLHRIIRR